MYRRLLPFHRACRRRPLWPSPRSASLRSEAAVPQIQFAAGEIHRALAARGSTLAEGALGGLAGDTASTRFVLAAGADGGANCRATRRGRAAIRRGPNLRHPRQAGVRAAHLRRAGQRRRRRHVRRTRPRRSHPPRYAGRPARFRPHAAHRAARHQVQHPAGCAHAELFRFRRRRAAEHPRNVELRFLAHLPRRTGAPSLQRALPVEPAPVSRRWSRFPSIPTSRSTMCSAPL